MALPARTCLRDERRDAIFGRDDARAAAAPHRPRAPDPGRRALARRGARRRRAREDARRRRPRASSTPRFPGSFRRVDKTLGFDERESTPRATPRAGRDERATDATSARAARVDGWLSRRTRTSLIACATTLNPPRCASRGARHRDAPSASARRDDASPNATAETATGRVPRAFGVVHRISRSELALVRKWEIGYEMKSIDVLVRAPPPPRSDDAEEEEEASSWTWVEARATRRRCVDLFLNRQNFQSK